MLKNIIYQIITVPMINKVLLNILRLGKPLLSLDKLIDFPVMGILDLSIGDIQFKMFSDGRDKIASGLFWGEGVVGFEANTVATFQKLLPHIHTMLDIGANTGIFSLIALGSNNQTQVHAFEPIPEVFKYLKRNFDVNGFVNGHAYQQAVGNQQGTITLHIPQHLTLATGSSAVRWEPDWSAISVDVIRLDDFVTQHHIERIDFIKIDVEKFEPQVIEGAQELIKRDRPIIICEILDDDVGVQIDNYFSNWDYCYYHIGIDAVTPQDSLISNIQYTATHIERNYVLIPSEKNEWLK